MPERSRTARNPHAVALGRRGGLIGGKARAKRLSAEQRSESARTAAIARWGPASSGKRSSRERILAEARKEFLRCGLDAARLDRIARAARVNKRMIYYHFASKDGLFREMLRRSTGALMQIAVAAPATSLADDLVLWQEAIRTRPHWLRLSVWEALSAPTHWVAGVERRNFWRGVVSDVERQQKDGALPSIDAAQLQLTILAVVMFPYLLPQMTEFITGMRADSDAFVAARADFLRDFAAILTRGIDGPDR